MPLPAPVSHATLPCNVPIAFLRLSAHDGGVLGGWQCEEDTHSLPTTRIVFINPASPLTVTPAKAGVHRHAHWNDGERGERI
jgi:hypothetical protein